MSWRLGIRWLELLVLFGGLPLLFASPLVSLPEIPTLVVVFIVVLVVLLRDPSFPRHRLWNLEPNRTYLKYIVRRFLVLSPLIVVLVVLLEPHRLLELPFEQPKRWLLLVMIYIALSVYPQELLLRGFFFYRYAPLFSNTKHLLGANIAAFIFLHIIYDNAIALVLSGFGGYFFATTYHRTQSLLVVSIEHALYGILLFTVGLGGYFI